MFPDLARYRSRIDGDLPTADAPTDASDANEVLT
jgi:hypothetical protein